MEWLNSRLRDALLREYQDNIWLDRRHILSLSPVFSHHQGKSQWGEERYFKITKRIYEDLEYRLAQSKYLAGEHYSIADIATWPWMARHKRHDVGLENYASLSRWYSDIAKRPSVIKGFKALNNSAEIDYP